MGPAQRRELHLESAGDADNDPDEGYFVTAVVNFDDISLADGETQTIVAKSDAGGFALEPNNSAGAGDTVLRFGVHVSGAYRYATTPAARFNGTDSYLLTGADSYLLTGAYDGDGGVRLWIDNDDNGIASGAGSQGVTRNDSPVILGGDPQGAASTRFHFTGKIQQLQVLRWGQH